MRSLGINGEGGLRGQPANIGSTGGIAVKTACACSVVTLAVERIISPQLTLMANYHAHDILYLDSRINWLRQRCG